MGKIQIEDEIKSKLWDRHEDETVVRDARVQDHFQNWLPRKRRVVALYIKKKTDTIRKWLKTAMGGTS